MSSLHHNGFREGFFELNLLYFIRKSNVYVNRADISVAIMLFVAGYNMCNEFRGKLKFKIRRYSFRLERIVLILNVNLQSIKKKLLCLGIRNDKLDR